MAAFRLGFEQEADAVELDVHLSSDGEVVVIHDSSTRRTTGHDQAVAGQTLEELRARDAGSWKGDRWNGEKIPTLAEALTTVPVGKRKRLFIEIKSSAEILPKLQRVLSESGVPPERLVIIGFNYETMRRAKELLPQIRMYWLVSPERDKRLEEFPRLEDLIEKTKEAKLEGLNLSFKFPIDQAFVSKVRAAGLELYVWTVNDAPVARELAEAGVQGITTDRPEWLRDQLK